MTNTERRKGGEGELEVAKVYQRHGFSVRGLEGRGDHTVVCGPAGELVLHSESKRQEQARPWSWWAQASSETPAGAVTVVAFRRSHAPWLAMLELEAFAKIARDAADLRSMPSASPTPGLALIRRALAIARELVEYGAFRHADDRDSALATIVAAERELERMEELSAR